MRNTMMECSWHKISILINMIELNCKQKTDGRKMSFLKNDIDSPISSHRNYIALIALANCAEVFRSLNLVGRNEIPESINSRDEFRKYFNAIITIDHIVDYMYWEDENLDKTQISCSDYKFNIAKQYPIIGKIASYANAYKHKKRIFKGDKENKKLIETLNFNKQNLNVDGESNYYLPYDLNLLKEAFKFWHEYINKGKKIRYEKD